MANANIQPFGILPGGQTVHRIFLQSGTLSCEVITYGAALRTLLVPDREGRPVDVVLGYDRLEQYLSEDGYLGATVGRVANRIAKGCFDLNGQLYQLPLNNGNNHLHGGPGGFSHRIWTIEQVSEASVMLSLISPDADQGYPGSLKVTATYTLQENALIVRHTAVSDKDTLCSLTNHSYFNLAGHNSGSATDQRIQIFANSYTPIDSELIPLGVVTAVEGTPMDLRQPIPIGTHMDDPDPQLIIAGGYDHNFVVDGPVGKLRPAAAAASDRTGITMQVDTTLPGVHFYTGNYLNSGRIGKGGCTYGPHHGFCLETHYFPDAVHHPHFPSPVLPAHTPYTHETVFRFAVSR